MFGWRRDPLAEANARLERDRAMARVLLRTGAPVDEVVRATGIHFAEVAIAERDLRRSQITRLPNDNARWEDDSIQFPRLICEISATQELDLEALCESMDLAMPYLIELFERASQVWERAKAQQ